MGSWIHIVCINSPHISTNQMVHIISSLREVVPANRKALNCLKVSIIPWFALVQSSQKEMKQNLGSDSFTISGLWVLGLTVSHINGFNCKLLSPDC